MSEDMEPTPAFEKPATPTVGETWWHRLNYTGVGYVANVVLSIALWDFFVSGRGRPVYRGIQRGVGAAITPFLKNPKAVENISEGFAKYTFSPLGGHILMVPVKYLEDHAGRITHKFNLMLDPNYQYKNAQIPEGTPDDDYPPLAHPPNTNNWLQIYARRGMGWAAVVASGIGLRTLKIEQPLEESFVRGFEKAAELSGRRSLQRLVQTPRMQRYARLSALEATLTVVTAGITALTKNTFGKPHAGEDELPDDALSIDVPGITENGNGSHARRFTLASNHVASAAQHVPLALQP